MNVNRKKESSNAAKRNLSTGLGSQRCLTSFLALVLFALGTTSAFSQESPLQVGEVLVHGTVVDMTDAVFPHVEITFKNQRIAKVAITDEEGNLRVGLRPGIYDTLFKIGINKPRYERAKIAVPTAGGRELIIVILPWCPSLGCPKDTLRFAKFGQGWTRQRSLNMHIVYSSKKKSRAGTVYGYAMFTYDTYTVFADQIVQNFKTKTLNVKGKGWIEDGSGRKEFNGLVIRFTKAGIAVEHSPNP